MQQQPSDQSKMESALVEDDPQKDETMANQEETPKDDDNTFCPLFMDGLPRNFADNPQLAAIASLLEESDHEEGSSQKTPASTIQCEVPVAPAGGGKARKNKGRGGRSHKPYSVPQKKNKDKAKQASLGEAQLFLSMWKL